MITRKTKVNAFAFILAFAVSLVYFIPVYWMLISSLKSSGTIFKYPPDFFPKELMFSNYVKMATYIPFFNYFYNSLIVSFFSTLGLVLSCPPVAYAFARLRWRSRNIMFFIMLSTMMLPYHVQMIPIYHLFKSFGWIGTFLPLIVPNYFGYALYIFLLRQFMLGIPKELVESAFIDGAGHFYIFAKIMLPLVRPAIFSVALLGFLANWTDFLAPIIFLNRQEIFTLTIGITHYIGRNKREWAYLMAACTAYIIPVVILFFCAQRRFVEGITFTGIKG